MCGPAVPAPWKLHKHSRNRISAEELATYLDAAHPGRYVLFRLRCVCTACSCVLLFRVVCDSRRGRWWPFPVCSSGRGKQQVDLDLFHSQVRSHSSRVMCPRMTTELLCRWLSTLQRSTTWSRSSFSFHCWTSCGRLCMRRCFGLQRTRPTWSFCVRAPATTTLASS